jgi:hypothetical protein
MVTELMAGAYEPDEAEADYYRNQAVPRPPSRP